MIFVLFRLSTEPVRLNVSLMDCLTKFSSDDTIEDFYSCAMKAKTHAVK